MYVGGVSHLFLRGSLGPGLQLSFSVGAGAGDRKPWPSPSKLAMCWQLRFLVAGARREKLAELEAFKLQVLALDSNGLRHYEK